MGKAYRTVEWVLAAILLLTAVASFISGIFMIVTGGMGMPLRWLEGTVFSSYLVPALILIAIIGGVSLIAGILLIWQKKLAIEISLASGFALLIWIYVEMYLIRESHFLQTIIFAEGVAILIACLILLKMRIVKNRRV